MLHKISSLRSYSENFSSDEINHNHIEKQLISSTEIGQRNFEYPIIDLPISLRLLMPIGLSTQ